MPAGAITQIALGQEFKIAPIREPGAAGAAAGAEGIGGFTEALGGALERLADLQQTAASQSEALALGKATDVQSVAIDVERAYLAIQLATQVRNRAVDSYHEIFRMQV